MDDLTERYRNSNFYLEKSLALIPTGSQTFSKSRYALPEKVSPLFLSEGKGSRVRDIDGNEYLDFISGLLTISLGYQDPDVDDAVKQQLKKGVSFSLSTVLEQELAEMLVSYIPCAEQVRFAKNGSDVTSAAIRLARAYTGRDHVATCGYHGWQDWYIGSTTRDLGVPQSTRDLTHRFGYNDFESLESVFERYPEKIAAVILEPMTFTEPRNNFLQNIKTLCKKQHAVLIFDEMITGFRFDPGGAQSWFNVTPDLATFGKGMANGFPLSAIVGRTEIMSLMDDIFFSGTFGGEALSIAAAIATIKKIVNEKVCDQNRTKGLKIKDGVNELIRHLGVGELFDIQGDPAWTLLDVKAHKPYSSLQLKSLFLQECYRHGILITGTHNLSYAHSSKDIESLLSVYRNSMLIVKQACDEGNINKYFKGEFLKPIFKLRN